MWPPRRSHRRSIRRLRAMPLNSGWRRRRPIARKPRRILRSCTSRPHSGSTPTKNTNKHSAGSHPQRPRNRRCATHAAYYAGVSELRLRRFEAARRRFAGLKNTLGFVGEAAALGEAEAAHALGDFDDAADIYEDILDEAAVDVPAIWLSLANAALADGDRKRAAEAYLHLYYEFPLSEHAYRPKVRCKRCPRCSKSLRGTRATSSRWGVASGCSAAAGMPDARNSFLRLKPHARTNEDAELVSLRLAEIEYFQGRYSNARDALRPFLDERRQAGGGALLLSDVAARAAQRRHVHRARARARTRFSREHLGRRSAQPSRDVLHSARSRRRGRCRCFARCTRGSRAAVMPSEQRGRPAGRHIARARWARPLGTSSRRLPVFRDPITVRMAVLVRPRARGDGRRARRARALPADDRRLSQHLLRPPGRERPAEAGNARSGRAASCSRRDRVAWRRGR